MEIWSEGESRPRCHVVRSERCSLSYLHFTLFMAGQPARWEKKRQMIRKKSKTVSLNGKKYTSAKIIYTWSLPKKGFTFIFPRRGLGGVKTVIFELQPKKINHVHLFEVESQSLWGKSAKQGHEDGTVLPPRGHTKQTPIHVTCISHPV